jgi:small nuclear ribonucleoprotein (snRNP)-like protein
MQSMYVRADSMKDAAHVRTSDVMKQHSRVVVRYCDGRIVKGSTLNFDPVKPTFLLELPDHGVKSEPLEVRLSDLKAVFFVKDLAGDPQYRELKYFDKPSTGRRLSVTFADGEQLVGVSLTYDANRDGFFLFPADARSNNERVFVIRKSVTKVERA